jgi:tetratricopeptide (TPR) repeat protein
VLLLPLLVGLLIAPVLAESFEADGDVLLVIQGTPEPFIATLSGGTTHFVGFRESLRGEGVRFKKVPPGAHLLRVETRCGAVLERVVNVALDPNGTPVRVQIRLSDAVIPDDWNGGAYSTSVRDLSWPAATRKALLDGWKRMERGDVKGARACLRKALTLSPDCADAWTNLGLIAEWDGNLEEAERFHREAIRLEPDHFARNLNLSELLERMGKTADAIAFGERALKMRPKDLGVNLHMGALFARSYRFDRVVPLLSTAKQIHKDSLGMTQVLLGMAYAETGDPGKAVEELTEWMQRFPDHPQHDLVQATCEELRAAKREIAVR